LIENLFDIALEFPLCHVNRITENTGFANRVSHGDVPSDFRETGGRGHARAKLSCSRAVGFLG
jgi:hypothetical protein